MSNRAIDLSPYDRDTRDLIAETCNKYDLTVSKLFEIIGFEDVGGMLFPCKNCIAYGFSLGTKFTQIFPDKVQRSYYHPGNGKGLCSNHHEA